MAKAKRVLFVCEGNLHRSSTAQRLYSSTPGIKARSAGLSSLAPVQVTDELLAWADVVFVMEREHQQWIAMRFEGLKLSRVDVLDIPDEFELMDPALIEMLRLMLDPEIDYLLSSELG